MNLNSFNPASGNTYKSIIRKLSDRRPFLEFAALPFAGFQHLCQMPRGFGHVLEPQISGREAEAQDVGVAEVADDAAGDQRLTDGVGVLMAEGQLAAATRRIGRAPTSSSLWTPRRTPICSTLCFFLTFILTFILTFGKFLANFERLVLGCIEAKFCK